MIICDLCLISHYFTTLLILLRLFVCGLRNTRYTDVRSRILKLIEEKQEISLQDLGDECVRMETIISDTNMIQNKTEEHGYIRKI